MTALAAVRVRTDALMRCCLATIRSEAHRTYPGQATECPACRAALVVADDGVWQWDGARGARLGQAAP